MSRMAQAIAEEVEKLRARRWGTKRRTPAMTDKDADGTGIAPEPEPAAETQAAETTAAVEGDSQMAKTTKKAAKKAATPKKTAKAAKTPKTTKRAAKADGAAVAASNGRGKLWDPNHIPKAKDLTLTAVDGNGNQYLNFRFADGTVVRAGLQGVGRKATAAKARDVVVEVLNARLGL